MKQVSVFISACVCCLLSACATLYATESGKKPLQADTCAASYYPENFFSVETHGFSYYVGPKEIGPAFSGCQTIWSEDKALWLKAYFEHGEVQSVIGVIPKNKTIACDYADGDDVRKSKTCIPKEYFPWREGNAL